MTTPSRLLVSALAAALLATPLLAGAQNPSCKFSAPRSLQLDLAGAKSVLFQVGSNTLKLKATAGRAHALAGHACASNQQLLQGLTLTQKRVGDKLVIKLAEERPIRISFGSNYAYLDLAGSVPDQVLVQLEVDSGDVWLGGGKAASVEVGSGEAELHDIAGLVTAKVGTGDLKLDGAGALNLLSIGSGDVIGTRIGGKAAIGSVGAGDLTLKQIGSGVELGSVSSGDAQLDDVTGDVVVGSIGSGDLRIRGVRGNLTVRSRGSGDIEPHAVTGTVNIPKEN